MQQNVRSAHKIIEMSLDAARNRILKLNMQVGMTSLAFGSGSLIAAIFGMNLKNYYESHPNAFLMATTTIVVLGCFIYASFIFYYYYTRKVVRKLTLRAHNNPFFDNINSHNYLHKLINETPSAELLRTVETAIGQKVATEDVAPMLHIISKRSTKDTDELIKTDKTERCPTGVYPMPTQSSYWKTGWFLALISSKPKYQ